MSRHTDRRSRSAYHIAFAALIFTLSQLLTACSGGPQNPPQAPPDARTAQPDPIDVLPPTDSGAASSTPKPPTPAPPTITEAQMGMPFYPGAMQYTEPGAGPVTDMAGDSDATLLLQTHDPASKVIAFYLDKLKGPDVTGKVGPPSRRDGSRDGKPAVTLSISDGRTLKAAEIRELDNLTIIELLRLDLSKRGKAVLPGSGPDKPADASSGPAAGIGEPSKTGDQSSGDSFISRSPATSGKPGTGAKSQQRSLQYP